MPPRERKGPAARRGDTKPDGRQDVRVPKDGSPGNRKWDQAWGKRQFELGMFEKIGETETGIPFGAVWRWLGMQEDLDAEDFPLPPNPCNGRAYVRDRDGRYVIDSDNSVLTRPCLRDAIQGGPVCYNHGGAITTTKRAARSRLEGTSDLVVERLLAIAMDPNADLKVVVQACNSLLDRAGIKTGVEVDVNVPGWQQVLQDLIAKGNNEES